jgi:GntP family gluconate:H+ symporter
MILLALAVAVGFIILATTRLQLHPAIALLLAALAFGAMTGMDGIELVNQVTTGFGATIGQIGIVIMAGAIIGTFLEKSGGVLVLARAILKRVGQKQVPATMSGIGFITSIPVFGDTGFIILASLNRALARMAGTSFAAGTIALALGLIASHTMVPPTPGPIATAALLDANLGLVIMLGLFTGLISAFVGWLFATRFAARTPLDPGEFSEETESDDIAQGETPGTVHSALPIVVPLVLILLGSLAALPSYPLGQGVLAAAVAIAGHPVIALFVGILIAITLPRKFELAMLGTTGWVGQAIANCATVILITGAGGAFGKVLQGSEIAEVVGGAVQSAQIGLFLPFLLAAALKTAQGSSTVAMLTSAGLTAPLLPAMGLDSEMARALAVVAIGAGSAVVSHTNDSFFWVVTQSTGMTVRKGLKLLSFGTLVMGTSAAVVVWLLGQVLI